MADLTAPRDMRAHKREYSTTLTVTCWCGRTATMAPRQRNDPKHPGQWCDGAYGDRHPISRMLGPDGETHR